MVDFGVNLENKLQTQRLADTRERALHPAARERRCVSSGSPAAEGRIGSLAAGGSTGSTARQQQLTGELQASRPQH